MQLSKETINILKNFSSINNGMLFTAGNEIRTASISKSCIGVAEIKETFSRQFAIYDMSQFLPVLSMFDEDHDIQLNEDHLLISSGNQSVSYRYTDVNNIIIPPYDIDLNSDTSTIQLSSTELNRVLRASAVLKLDTIWIRKERPGWIEMTAINSDYNDTNQFNISIECSDDFKNFEFRMKVNAMNILKLDYEIGFCNDYQFILFSNKEHSLNYYIAGDAA